MKGQQRLPGKCRTQGILGKGSSMKRQEYTCWTWIYTFCSYCLFFRFWFLAIPGKQVMEAHSWQPAKTYAFCWAPWLWGLNPTHGRLCILLVCSERRVTLEQLSWRWPVRLKNKQNEQQHLDSFPSYSTWRSFVVVVIVWFSDERCLGWENLQQLWERQKLSRGGRTCFEIWVKTLLSSECPSQPWVWSFRFGFWSCVIFQA